MASKFADYPETLEANFLHQDSAAQLTPWELKVERKMKKMQKRLKRIEEARENLKQRQAKLRDERQQRTSFLERAKEAVIKAIPSVVKVVVSAAVSAVFGFLFKKFKSSDGRKGVFA